MAERINQAAFQTKVKEAAGKVLVDYYSDTCIPCKRMAGIVSGLEEELAGEIAVNKVNVNFDQQLAEQEQVMSAPTFVAYVNGTEAARVSGVVKKEVLIDLFNKKKEIKI